MSITDELREFAKLWLPTHYVHNELLAIADRIDAEHEKACDDAWNNGYEADYLGIEKWLTEHPQAMELHGWVRLPKDADGEYIHMGDRMENGEMVARIVLTDGSWEPTVYTAATPNQLHEYYCHDIRHYHEPTVEDVLREFVEKMSKNIGMYTSEAIDADEWRDADNKTIAEYAAKLRLANDGKVDGEQN